MELIITGILIVIGALLLVAEVALIPGFGIAGILGAGAMLGSIAYSFMNIGEPAGWICVAIVILIVITLILWAIYGKSLDKVALKDNIDSTVANEEAINIKVGDQGVSTTRLALIGEAQFGNSIVEVTSCDGYIDEKESVTVKRIAANVIYVCKNKNNQ